MADWLFQYVWTCDACQISFGSHVSQAKVNYQRAVHCGTSAHQTEVSRVHAAEGGARYAEWARKEKERAADRGIDLSHLGTDEDVARAVYAAETTTFRGVEKLNPALTKPFTGMRLTSADRTLLRDMKILVED